MEKSDTYNNWLDAGYKHFALFGPENISIKKISAELNYSRSSFYNYFGDIQIFREKLLQKHWQIHEQFMKQAKVECKYLFPDLYDVLAKYPIGLQFSLQLFHNRNVPAYNYLFTKTYDSFSKELGLSLFKSYYNLDLAKNEMYKLWITVGESWYSRITPNDLTSSTLQKNSKEILKTVFEFVNSNLYSSLK